MQRHELDVVSLLAGLFFTLMGTGVLLAHTTDLHVDVEWVLPVALIAVGVVGLVATIASGRRSGDRDAPDRAEDVEQPTAADG